MARPLRLMPLLVARAPRHDIANIGIFEENVDEKNEKDEKAAKHPLADPDESGPVSKVQRAQNLFGADADLV